MSNLVSCHALRRVSRTQSSWVRGSKLRSSGLCPVSVEEGSCCRSHPLTLRGIRLELPGLQQHCQRLELWWWAPSLPWRRQR